MNVESIQGAITYSPHPRNRNLTGILSLSNPFIRTLTVIVLLSLATGCTSPLTDHGQKAPGRSRSTVVETNGYPNTPYYLSIIEFDDMGQLVNRQQFDNADRFIREIHADRPVLLLTFIHGWGHSARERDGNLTSFRALLTDIGAEKLSNNSGKQYAVVGVYLAWRGNLYDFESRDLQSTFPFQIPAALGYFNRDAAARRVAGVGASEVILTLAGAAKTRSLVALDALKEEPELLWDNSSGSIRLPHDNNESRVVILGHSMGALIAEQAVAQSLIGHMAIKNAQHDEALTFMRSTTNGIGSAYTNMIYARSNFWIARDQACAIECDFATIDEQEAEFVENLTEWRTCSTRIKTNLQKIDQWLKTANSTHEDNLKLLTNQILKAGLTYSPTGTSQSNLASLPPTTQVSTTIRELINDKETLINLTVLQDLLTTSNILKSLVNEAANLAETSKDKASDEVKSRVRIFISKTFPSAVSAHNTAIKNYKLDPPLQPLASNLPKDSQISPLLTSDPARMLTTVIAELGVMSNAVSKAIDALPNSSTLPWRNIDLEYSSDQQRKNISSALTKTDERIDAIGETVETYNRDISLEQAYAQKNHRILSKANLPCVFENNYDQLLDCFHTNQLSLKARYEESKQKLAVADKTLRDREDNFRMFGAAAFMAEIMGNTLPADLLLLINPASSAIDGIKLIEAFDNPSVNTRTEQPGLKYFPELSGRRPLIINLSSKSDRDTGVIYPTAHWISGLTKSFSNESQKQLYKYPAAHLTNLVSHTVTLNTNIDCPSLKQLYLRTPLADSEFAQREQALYLRLNLSEQNGWIDSSGKTNLLGGDTIVTPSGVFQLKGGPRPGNEYWVVDADRRLMASHNGFWTTEFLATVASLVRISNLYNYSPRETTTNAVSNHLLN